MTVITAREKTVSLVREAWRKYVPNRVRDDVNRVRATRRELAWQRPRDLGELRRTKPFSTWGSSRGGSIARRYIAQFMQQHSSDIRGRALEIAGDEYIRMFGTGVKQTDVLDVFADNPAATIVADFADAPNIPDNSFDCVLVTQVLSWIYDVRAPFQTAHRILAPNGVLLAATPGICRIAPVEAELFGQWWHFTAMSAKRVAEEIFGEGNVEVLTYGNVLAAAGWLFGLGQYDLTPEELDVHDPAFEVIVAVRAVKRD
jgi:SAM-dependent methyltransferase